MVNRKAMGEQRVWLGRAGWPVSCPRFPRPVLVYPHDVPQKLSQWHPWAVPSLWPLVEASLCSTPGLIGGVYPAAPLHGTGLAGWGEVRAKELGGRVGPWKWALATGENCCKGKQTARLAWTFRHAVVTVGRPQATWSRPEPLTGRSNFTP